MIKVKHILLIFLLGSMTLIIASLFKILHWPGAPQLLIVSAVLQVVAEILAIWKLFTIKSFREFLNS